jgi:hypothetical protein
MSNNSLFKQRPTTRLAAFFTLAWGSLLLTLGADQPRLESHLEPLRPLLERTWRGPLKNSTPEKPIVDIMRWERALNGQTVRVLHSINDGLYGGETIIRWDAGKQQVVYYYFTTSGFSTTGTMQIEGKKILSHEVVTGSTEGITETRGVSELTPDGGLHIKSEYLKNGKWVPGHEATYREDAAAKVVFQ